MRTKSRALANLLNLLLRLYPIETLRRLDTISDLKSEDAVSAYLGVAKGKRTCASYRHTKPSFLLALFVTALSIEFYQQKRPLYTANALKALIALNLVDTEYHWLARSAMARLYCLYNRQMDLAYDLYLDILEQRWEIKKEDILKLAQVGPYLSSPLPPNLGSVLCYSVAEERVRRQ